MEPDIARRAAAILRDEIEAGALANIVEAERVWAAARPRVLGAEALRHAQSDLEQLAEIVLELLVPRKSDGFLLRPAASIARGQAASIATRVANETTRPVDVRLACSNFLTDAGLEIANTCLRVLPERLHVDPGQTARVELHLEVPAEAAPGLYRAVLEAEQRPDLRAVIVVPVI